MLSLKGTPTNKFKSLIGIITHKQRRLFERKDYILVSKHIGFNTIGYIGAITNSQVLDHFYLPDCICNVTNIDKLHSGDIVCMSPEGKISVLWTKGSSQNVLFLTESCNCKCLMCPQPPKKHDPALVTTAERILDLIKGEKQSNICISGGEPTILKDSFIKILNRCIQEHPESQIDILTNGKLLANKEYTYQVLVSEVDCTECGLCIEECPGKNGKKALEFGPVDLENQRKANEYFNNYENPEVLNKFTIPGASLCKPRFEFSGACAGCGETPYLKMLSQLFGEKLVISNATGCSSIYGGSAPSTPYLIPWVNSLFEDNAEAGYGIYLSYKMMHNRIKEIINQTKEAVNDNVKSLYNKWLDNENDFVVTKEVKEALEKEEIPKDLKNIINYVPARSVFIVGGDGWAYDIGFGGIDHVLSSGENINILVLDTEVYSNTGGQSSKSTRRGAVAEFANMGKKTYKKDLFKIAMSYPNCYVAETSFGANFMHTIKCMKEAEEHKGPSIIICYCPCIEQGIKGGMSNSINQEKEAVTCGYINLMRYVPEDNKLYLDSKEPDFTKYHDFLMHEVRYSSLVIKNKEMAEELLNSQIEYAKKRHKFYLEESKKENIE